jgi:cell division protein FtsW (lipid II flippase)
MTSVVQIWNPFSIFRHALIVFKSSNPFISLIVLALTGIGLLGVFTAGRHLHTDPYYYFKRQLFAVLIGLGLLCILALMDYSNFRFKTQWPYFFTISLLVAVLMFGNQSWLALPFFNFQPSELGKLILILYISCAMAFDRIDTMRFWADSFPILVGCFALIGPLVTLRCRDPRIELIVHISTSPWGSAKTAAHQILTPKRHVVNENRVLFGW